MNVRTPKPFLNWLGLDFCGEECLGKYQLQLPPNCDFCHSAVFKGNKAKHCQMANGEVKHFCSQMCHIEFMKRIKMCAFCNKDLFLVNDSFMAPVGDKFKDFCSQACLLKFEAKGNASGEKKGNFNCAVCGKFGPIKHEFQHEHKLQKLCSDSCFSAFKYANKINMNNCDNCSVCIIGDSTDFQCVQYEGQQKRFCSFMCVNTFKTSNKKMVACAWCGNNKDIFDMIERVDANNKYQLFCSLNCLSLYRVNLQANSNQVPYQITYLCVNFLFNVDCEISYLNLY